MVWFVNGFVTKRNALPFQNLHSSFPKKLVEVLPALHSLTGCDSTSKVGTKLAAVSREGYFKEITDFGKERLDSDILIKAENFLVHCVKENADCTVYNV